MKESFILYNSFYEPIKALKNEQLGKLLRAIFDYTINGEITQDDEILIAFMFIKNQIDIDTEKWQEEKAKRSKAGRLGGIQRAINKGQNLSSNAKQCLKVLSNAKQSQANQADNVNVNVNVNDNVNDIIINNNIYDFIEKNFGRTLKPLEFEEISKWEDNELTRYAIKNTILNGIYNINYISTILHNYKMNNIETVQQAIKQKEKFKKKNQTEPEWFDKEIQKKEDDGELEKILKDYK